MIIVSPSLSGILKRVTWLLAASGFERTFSRVELFVINLVLVFYYQINGGSFLNIALLK